MATEVLMLRFTHEMEEGTIARWMKSEGDPVRQGEPLFEVITDKVNVEVEAPATGTLRRILVPADQTVPVGAAVAWIGTPDEPLPGRSQLSPPRTQSPPPGVSVPPSSGGPKPALTIDDSRAGGRTVASPIAQRIAREKGVDLTRITGSGPQGRITEADVQRFAETMVVPTSGPGIVPQPSGNLVPLSRMRKAIGQRMVRSVQTAPHFTLSVEADMTEAVSWRDRGPRGKQSVTTLLVMVVAQALRRFPQVNSSFTDQGILQHASVNIGVAVAVEQGLVVPVIHDADQKTLTEIGDALSRLEGKARSLHFEVNEVSGATFTITNLGMFGIDSFQAIINPPEAAILAVGRIGERPVGVSGEVALRPTMHLTLSVDHRILDGAVAAPFLMEIMRSLEHPPV